jgi:hypothetical protein
MSSRLTVGIQIMQLTCGFDLAGNKQYKMTWQRPPLWSSGQSSWLQILRSGFDSRRYRIFWEVVDLEQAPLSLVSTTEELLERKIVNTAVGIRRSDHVALSPPTSGGRSWTRTVEFSFSSACPHLAVRVAGHNMSSDLYVWTSTANCSSVSKTEQ